jgi:hypothetical protein
MTGPATKIVPIGCAAVHEAFARAGGRFCPSSISLRFQSLFGGKDLSEEYFDFLLVRYKQNPSRS